jgi:transposase InsO family protein
LISESFLKEILPAGSFTVRPIEELIQKKVHLLGAGDGTISYSGYTELLLRLGRTENAREVKVPFIVTKTSKYNVPILGTNVMEVLMDGENITWEARRARLASFGLDEPEVVALTGLLHRRMEKTVASSVTIDVKQTIPAKYTGMVECSINSITVNQVTPVMFEPAPEWQADQKVLTLYEAVSNLTEGTNHSVTVKVRNNSDHDFHLEPGDHMGTLEEVDSIEESVINFVMFGGESHSARVDHARMQGTGPADCSQDQVGLDSREEPPDIVGLGGPDAAPVGVPQPQFAELSEEDVEEGSRPFFAQLKQMSFPVLSEELQKKAKQMLWEERGAFSQNPDDIGSAPELQLHLNTVDEIPVQRNYNAIPKTMYAEVRAHLDSMLKKGWIRKSESSWCSPVVLVRKKSGSWRLCVDFRLLNAKCHVDKHPIPRITEAIDSLSGSRIFSVLDLSRAYYQGYMSPESSAKTAFTTPFGFFEWRRIPFGLSDAVPKFQRFMEKTLAEYRDEFALPYLDDTIVHDKDTEIHIDHVRLVLQKFQEKGLKLNVSKCNLFQTEVSYLGRIISEGGYRMDENSVKAVRELSNKTIETVGQVRQLLGLLGYHRRHVQDFATIAKPLTDLLATVPPPEDDDTPKTKSNKGVSSRQKIHWTTEHQSAMERLISLVTNPPILAYADFNSEFFMHCDASGAGLGAILYQEQEGKVRVIAYASRTLKPAEKHYHSTKLEFISLKWGVCEAFRDYLGYSDHFCCFTDNNPLLFVMRQKKPNSTIQRWVSELGEFMPFTVLYRPGEVNRDADCLSRMPLDIEAYMPLCKEEASLDNFRAMVGTVSPQQNPVEENARNEPTPVSSGEEDNFRAMVGAVRPQLSISVAGDTIDDMKQDQEEDCYIGPVLSILRQEKVISDLNALPEAVQNRARLLLRERAKLLFDEDKLLRRRGPGGVLQVVLPLKHRELIYKALHTDMGHLGAERIIQLARQRVYWPLMPTEIEEFTRQRCRCRAQRKVHQEAVAPLVSINSSAPMELVVIDFLHLEKCRANYEYILLIVDHFTRYAQAHVTKNKSSLTAAKCIFEDFVLRFGLPSKLHHDQGREWDNKLFKELQRYCGIMRSRTTSYHPQGNGTVERMNSTLLQMLRALAESEKPKWNRHVNKLLAAYNATTHSSTGYSPHYLLFGREPLLPLDVMLGPRLSLQKVTSYNKFVSDWETRMSEAYAIAQNNIRKGKRCNEEYWKKRLIASKLEVGDKVLVKNKETGGPGKLRAYWEQEIYVVTKVYPDGVVYDVKHQKGGTKKRTLHRNMLLPCEMIELEEISTPLQISTTLPANDQAAPVTRRKHSSTTPSRPGPTSSNRPGPTTRSQSMHSRTTRQQVEEESNYDASCSSDEELDYQCTVPTQQPTVDQSNDPANAGAAEDDEEDEAIDAVIPADDEATEMLTSPSAWRDDVFDHITGNGAGDQEEEEADKEDEEEEPTNHDEAGEVVESASDPGEGSAGAVVSEDTTANQGRRWSDRRGRPPDRLEYYELGNPAAALELVPEEPRVQVNASTVLTSVQGDGRRGLWNWVQDALTDLGDRLY